MINGIPTTTQYKKYYMTERTHVSRHPCFGDDDGNNDTWICVREQILVNKSDKSDHPHQQEPWCFVEVVNKVGVEAMPTNF